jgi:hypothetical protein
MQMEKLENLKFSLKQGKTNIFRATTLDQFQMDSISEEDIKDPAETPI